MMNETLKEEITKCRSSIQKILASMELKELSNYINDLVEKKVLPAAVYRFPRGRGRGRERRYKV